VKLDPAKRMEQLRSALKLADDLARAERDAKGAHDDAVTRLGIAQKLVELRNGQLQAELQGRRFRSWGGPYAFQVRAIDADAAAVMEADDKIDDELRARAAEAAARAETESLQ
jgi:hypothetical protein